MANPIGFSTSYDGSQLQLSSNSSVSSFELANSYWGFTTTQINVTGFKNQNVNSLYTSARPYENQYPIGFHYIGPYISQDPTYPYADNSTIIRLQSGFKQNGNPYYTYTLNSGVKWRSNTVYTWGKLLASGNGIDDKPWNSIWNSGQFTFNPGNKTSYFKILPSTLDNDGGYKISLGENGVIDAGGATELKISLGSAGIVIDDEVISFNRSIVIPGIIFQGADYTPSTPTSYGISGQIKYDKNYIYRHNGDNWTKVQMATGDNQTIPGTKNFTTIPQVNGVNVALSNNVVNLASVPASPTSAGSNGQIATDSLYFYAHNGSKWLRTALAEW